MKRIFVTTLLIAITTLYLSCSGGKHIYAVNESELARYARKAKEPGIGCFAVTKTNDTLRGESIKRFRSKGKEKLSIGGKQVFLDDVRCYQNKQFYQLGKYERMYRGRINLYMWQDFALVRDPRDGTTHYVSKTSFFLGGDSTVHVLTLTAMNADFSDCPAALAQLPVEFVQYNGSPNSPINDYRAIYRVLKIFEDCHKVTQ